MLGVTQGQKLYRKSQEASGEEISGTVKHLNRALESVKCKRRFTENEILNKNWE